MIEFPPYIYMYRMRRDTQLLEVRKYIQENPTSPYWSDQQIYYYKNKYGKRHRVRIYLSEEGAVIKKPYPPSLWYRERNDNDVRLKFARYFEAKIAEYRKLEHNASVCRAAAMCGKIISEEEEE